MSICCRIYSEYQIVYKIGSSNIFILTFCVEEGALDTHMAKIETLETLFSWILTVPSMIILAADFTLNLTTVDPQRSSF